MKKRHKFSISNALVLLLIVILIVLVITSIFYSRSKILHYQEYNLLLKVTNDTSGFGIGIIPGMIYFGKMSAGNSGMQQVVLMHNYQEPVLVQMVVSGSLKNWVVVSDNNFVLERNVKKTVNVTATVPEGASLGNHTGKLKIYLKRI